MSKDLLSKRQSEFQKVVDYLKNDINALRTGRASPAVLEGVVVEAYDTKTPLQGLAAITVPDARSLLIEPWDKAILKDIERAIIEAKLNLNPVVQGSQIRVPLPALTEESRKQLVKTLGEKLEHARKGVRNVRDEAKAEIQKAEKDKEISEDDKYRQLDQLDKMAAGANERIKNVGEEKEKEIMTI